MNKITVQLPANRDYTGQLEIQNAAGKCIAGPFRVCGRVDDDTALNHKNPARDPLLPFGDIPFGEYQVVKIMPSGPGTPYSTEEFGAAGVVLLRPRLGDAALADANGRFGFFIQGGARSRNGLLRPTRDGSLRLSDQDQRKFIRALQKLDEGGSHCLVVCTARLGVKVAGLVPAAVPHRKSPASLLLAGSVAVSAVTGTIRQALVRSAIQAAGASIASTGLVIFAETHVSAQTGGDYHPTGGGAMDQANTVNQNSQDATHATTDEQAHESAGNGIDTPATTAPPVDLHDKDGIVSPNAASGEMPPASAAGIAPGSPVSAPPRPADTTEETTPPANTTPETQTMPDQTPPATETAPAAGDQSNPNTENPTPQSTSTTETSTGNSGDTTPHLKDSLPGTYLNDDTGNGNNNPAGIKGLPGTYINGARPASDATGPSDTTLRPLDQIDRGVKAAEDTTAPSPQPENQSTLEPATPADNSIQTATPPPDAMHDAVAEPTVASPSPSSGTPTENQTTPETANPAQTATPTPMVSPVNSMVNPAVAIPVFNSSVPASTTTPSDQAPAAQAIINHDSQNLANPDAQTQTAPQPGPAPTPVATSSDVPPLEVRVNRLNSAIDAAQSAWGSSSTSQCNFGVQAIQQDLGEQVVTGKADAMVSTFIKGTTGPNPQYATVSATVAEQIAQAGFLVVAGRPAQSWETSGHVAAVSPNPITKDISDAYKQGRPPLIGNVGTQDTTDDTPVNYVFGKNPKTMAAAPPTYFVSTQTLKKYNALKAQQQ